MNARLEFLREEILGPNEEENNKFRNYIIQTLDSLNTINAGLISVRGLNYLDIDCVNKTGVRIMFSLTPELSIWTDKNGSLSTIAEQALVFLNLKVQDFIDIEKALQSYAFTSKPQKYRIAIVYNIEIPEEQPAS